MVSVIVPAYNAEATLGRCIDSILNQHYSDFELIIVNDGSSDNTSAIIDAYAINDKRIVPIHKANGGVSSARNVGLDVAKGEYIAFADADDEVKSEWLSSFVNALENDDICVQGCVFQGSNQSIVKGFLTPLLVDKESKKALITELVRHDFLGYSVSKIFKKELIDRYNLRFDEQIRFREDDVFVLQYVEHISNWTYTNEANYIYYVPEGSKVYGQSATACTESVFRSLNVIYEGDIPEIVAERMTWSIKGAAIERLLSGEKLSIELINLYRKFIASNSKGIKAKITDYIVENSRKLGVLSNTLIRIIHSFSK